MNPIKKWNTKKKLSWKQINQKVLQGDANENLRNIEERQEKNQVNKNDTKNEVKNVRYTELYSRKLLRELLAILTTEMKWVIIVM